MPISERKLQANRLNAQKSTGPRTPEGKAVCAQNPVTHGLRARNAVMLLEDREAFQELCTQLFDDWQPLTASEIHLVEQMAASHWKLARVEKLIAATGLQSSFMHIAFRDKNSYRTRKGSIVMPDLSRSQPELKMIDLLNGLERHAASLERSYRQAMQTLIRLQQIRNEKMERLRQLRQTAEPPQEEEVKVMTAGAGGGPEAMIEFDPPEPKPPAEAISLDNELSEDVAADLIEPDAV